MYVKLLMYKSNRGLDTQKSIIKPTISQQCLVSNFCIWQVKMI